MTLPRHPLLDHAPPTPAEFAAVEVAAGRILRTDDDVVIVQAEAALALEAVLLGLVRPGIRTLSLSSGAYGIWFATELRKLGAAVTVLEVDSRNAVDPADVASALERDPSIELVALVHAETLSGNVNPASEICRIVRAHGALCIVDAVASIGAHALETSKWGIDLCIAGPQKALAGSSGTSLVSVSERGWEAMRANPSAPRDSFLSLLDWKERWIDAGRRQIPGTPAIVEMRALEAACARVLGEGLDQVIARHERVARGARAGVRALGLELWPVRDEVAANAVTVVEVPDRSTPRPSARLHRSWGSRSCRGAVRSPARSSASITWGPARSRRRCSRRSSPSEPRCVIRACTSTSPTPSPPPATRSCSYTLRKRRTESTAHTIRMPALQAKARSVGPAAGSTPCVSARIESTTWVIGWLSANARSHDG